MSLASGKVALVEKKMIKTELPSFRSGDQVKVHVKIKEGDKERIQIFEGIVIGIQNTGSRKAFTVRKMSHGVGVERVFPFYSPMIAKIEVVQVGKVRRAKLTYLKGLSGRAARIKNKSENEMQ